MNIKEKAEAHDKALERARKELQTCGSIDCDAARQIFRFFPELKESEDERIRKHIISVLEDAWQVCKNIDYDNSMIQEDIAWLEKQKEPELSEDLGEYVTELNKQFPEVSFAKLSRIAVRVKNWLEEQGEANTQYWRGYREGKQNVLDKYAELEKQGEHTDKVEPKFEIGDEIKTKNEDPLTITKINEQGYWSGDLFICSFEDSSKWKLVGKVIKPKFNVGDWIVNDYCFGKVIEITNDAYLLDTGQGIPFSCEHNVHLWTIRDAKDGDVLVDKWGNICIYQGDTNAITWHSYCYCGVNKMFYDEGRHEFPCYPATKEQRDILFQKMKEAGYTFDFEKKELKKIVVPIFHIGDRVRYKGHACDGVITEITYADYICGDTKLPISTQDKLELVKQKSSWSEEDEDMIQALNVCIDAAIKSGMNYISFGSKSILIEKVKNRLKSFTEMVKGGKINTVWGEEDEKIRKSLLRWIQSNSYTSIAGIQINDVIAWLKSLRPQINVTDKELAQARKEAYNEVLDKIEYHDEWPTFDDGWNAAIWYLKKRNDSPQSHWTPSDAQIQALKEACDKSWEPDGLDPLYTLYKDLKKLKGE